MPNIGKATSDIGKVMSKKEVGLVPPPFCDNYEMSKKDRVAYDLFKRQELPPAAILDQLKIEPWKVPVYVCLDPDGPPPPPPAYITPPKHDIPTCNIPSAPIRKYVPVPLRIDDNEEDIKYLREEKDVAVVEELFSRLLTVSDVVETRFSRLEQREDECLMNSELTKKTFFPTLLGGLEVNFSDVLRDYSLAYSELKQRGGISKIIKQSFPAVHQLDELIETYNDDDVTYHDILSHIDDLIYNSWQQIETVVDRQLIEYSTSISQRVWFIPEVKPDDSEDVKRVAPVTPARPKTAPRVGTFVAARTPGVTRPATISRAKQTTPRATGSPKKFVKAVTPRLQ